MLKYLFTAEFKDGSILAQNPEDTSAVEPEKRSAYYDVAQKGIENLSTFTLFGEGCLYMVDLKDGAFEVNGIRFYMHTEHLKDFKLIFWRKHTHQFTANHDAKTLEQIGPIHEDAHVIVYQIGWQATGVQDGKNYQQVMNIL